MASASSQPRFARLERWLVGLPHGLDSYPEALAKGSLLRSVIEGQPAAELIPQLSPVLRAYLADPPMPGAWLPETHLTGLIHSIADLRRMTDGEARAWARERNRALFSSPAYRILMAVVSPGSMLRFAARRWENWHRGTSLEAGAISDEGVRLVLRFPAGLFDAPILGLYAEIFEVALEMSHARKPRVRLQEEEAGVAVFLATW